MRRRKGFKTDFRNDWDQKSLVPQNLGDDILRCEGFRVPPNDQFAGTSPRCHFGGRRASGTESSTAFLGRPVAGYGLCRYQAMPWPLGSVI